MAGSPEVTGGTGRESAAGGGAGLRSGGDVGSSLLAIG
jgi:hypothetical protein